MKTEKDKLNEDGDLNVVCEVEIDCSGAKMGNDNYYNFFTQRDLLCPEMFFEWRFNDYPVRTLLPQKGYLFVLLLFIKR